MRVLVIGLGKTGKELIKFYKSLGIEYHIYNDTYDANEYDFYKKYDPNVHYDIAVKSPGISYSHKVVSDLINKGVDVIDEIELAFSCIKGKIIGITGTNGKSTTTNMLYEILKGSGKRVFLAGNIGIPLISYVNNSKEEDIYVTELSSFQLERIKKFKCDSAVITNITPDHLQRHVDMQGYIDAKKNILKNLSLDNLLVLNYDDELLMNSVEKEEYNIKYFSVVNSVDGAYFKDGKIYVNNKFYVDLKDTNLSGLHNIMNALSAIILAKNYDVEDYIIKDVLSKYKSLDHRYEVLGEKNNIRYINDSKSTNPESSIPAIKFVEKPTILIMGGMEKGSDFTELVDYITNNIEYTYIFGECKKRIEEFFRNKKNYNYKICNNLDECFDDALSIAKSGYDILFSPACASWDMYDNFEKRGEHFKELYWRIK